MTATLKRAAENPGYSKFRSTMQDRINKMLELQIDIGLRGYVGYSIEATKSDANVKMVTDTHWVYIGERITDDGSVELVYQVSALDKSNKIDRKRKQFSTPVPGVAGLLITVIR
jgi:hypothetical protein